MDYLLANDYTIDDLGTFQIGNSQMGTIQRRIKEYLPELTERLPPIEGEVLAHHTNCQN